MTLSNLEIEENVIGSSNLLFTEPEQSQEYNVKGLRPTTEMPQQPQTIDTTIGPIILNFDQSCLEPDQVPLNVRQSMRSLPNDSQLPLLPPENQSSMVKKNVVPKKKQAEKRKYSCPEPDYSKSYTQSHNLKDHQRKKHKDIN